MRILGPNGQPFESGPPVSEEVKTFVERAKEIAAQGDPASGLQQMVFAFQTDVNSDLVLDTTCDLLKQMVQVTGAEQSDELQLFENLRAKRDDPLLYYQVGERFSQLQQTFVARPFLARAQELIGDQLNELSQAIDVNYAQVLMDQGVYQDAIDAFHTLNDKYGGLPIWLVLEMAECYALLRQVEEADAVYAIAPEESAAQFPGMPEVRDEVGDLIARVRDFEDRQDLTVQEWHYVQTRGILLEINPDEEHAPGGRFVLFQPSEEEIAYVVGVTAATFDAKGYAPNRILWLGPTSEPLARLFAQWWEVDEANVRAYQAGDNTDDEEDLGILVMAHSYDVLHLEDEASFIDLASARAGLITFALDLRWTERQPLTPDVAGFMSQQCNLPWETRFQVNPEDNSVTRIDETRDASTIAEAIGEQFPDDEECDDVAKEVLAVYDACTDLILDHRDGTLMRRPMITHSPIRSPRMGF